MTAYYLVLLHIASAVPVGIEGAYPLQQCQSILSHRAQADDREQAVLTRHGYQWLCVTPAQVNDFVRVNHCSIADHGRSRAGGVALTFECLGK